MDGVTHTRARAWLHAGRFSLDRQAQAALDGHLRDCRDCRGYAAYLAAIEPVLTRALHTRWDGVRTPALPMLDDAPHPASSLNAPGGHWVIPVLAGLITLIAVILLAGPNLASQVGFVVYPTASQTARAVATAIPLKAATAVASATPLLSPAPTGLIAFVSRRDNGNGEIYVMHADGSHLVNVSNDPGQDGSPAWSPDGQQLAFISNRTGHREVFLVRPDGSKLRPLTLPSGDDYGDVASFSWSPDDERLALMFPPRGQGNQKNGLILWVWLDGRNATTVASTNVQWQWSTAGLSSQWSPDNHWYAFSGYDADHNLELLVAKSDGSQGQAVAGFQGAISGTHELLADYAWSPDSTRLAYLQEGPLLGETPNQHFDLSSLSAQIYTVRPDGSDRQLLLDLRPAPNGIVGVNWSPDGKYLLYSASVGMTGCMHLHLLEVATRLDTELAGVCHALRTALPAWSADSGRLIFAAEVENEPSQGAFVVLLNVAEALRRPAEMTVTRLLDSAALSGATVLDFDPVWQPTGR